jgi:hypothetical protein
MRTYLEKLSNRNLLLIFVFILLPFFDAINGYLVVKGIIASAGLASPSQLGRLLVSIFLVYLVAVKKLSIWPTFLFVYLFIVEVCSGFFHINQYGFSYGVVSAYKLGYLILLTMVLKHYSQTTEGMNQLGNFFKYNLIIIASMLYFSTITGIGNSTYGFGFGTKSFFASGNGLGLYIGIGTLFLIGLKTYKLVRIEYKTILYIALSIVLIGSKTALVLALVSFITIIFLSKYRLIFILLFSSLLILFLPKIIGSLSVIFDVILLRLNNSNNLLIYLGSGRIDYVVEAFDNLFQSDPNALRLVFGMGAFTSFQNPLKVTVFDTLETDLFDLFFMYGFLSVICFITIVCYVLYKLRKFKILFIGMLLLSLHSIIAGHVLFNGMSSVCFALFICVSNYLSIHRSMDVKAIT